MTNNLGVNYPKDLILFVHNNDPYGPFPFTLTKFIRNASTFSQKWSFQPILLCSKHVANISINPEGFTQSAFCLVTIWSLMLQLMYQYNSIHNWSNPFAPNFGDCWRTPLKLPHSRAMHEHRPLAFPFQLVFFNNLLQKSRDILDTSSFCHFDLFNKSFLIYRPAPCLFIHTDT